MSFRATPATCSSLSRRTVSTSSTATRADTADTLVRGTELEDAVVADKYERALRRLGPGPARERLCQIARHAAVDAGYLPENERDRAVFLYLTQQWELYDAADPDGQLIHRAWVASRMATFWGDRSLSDEISEVARRAGRPDPLARWLQNRPEPRTDPTERRTGRRGPIGGYSGAWGDPGGSVHT
jgi:hypothetical protein